MAPAPQWLTNDFLKDIIKRAIDHEISISDDEIIAYISKKRNNQIKSKTWITYVDVVDRKTTPIPKSRDSKIKVIIDALNPPSESKKSKEGKSAKKSKSR